MFLWPSLRWNSLILAPFCSIVQAKVCRNRCIFEIFNRYYTDIGDRLARDRAAAVVVADTDPDRCVG